jgi:Ca2+/Na+ antiporter
MALLQEIIRKLEVEGGTRYLRIMLGALAVLGLIGIYNWRAFQNLGSQEAMDQAQLARNLAQGKGYTTLFVRPFSIYLVKQHYLDKHGLPHIGESVDMARLNNGHPDLANPPVYPVLLAGLMKVLPFRYPIAQDGGASRYQPDLLIALFNQFLLVVLAGLVLLLARRLFDWAVAWLSALLVLGTELFWQFSLSGLPTMLLLVLFTGLVWLLVVLEHEAREPGARANRLVVLALGAGLLLGLGALTRYSFGWLVVPVVAFLLWFGGERRIPAALLALSAFVLVLAPWVVRNYLVSGTPFGTAGYALLEGRSIFTGHNLQRWLSPDFSQLGLFVAAHATWGKLLGNVQQVLQNDLPKLGGSWLTAFFLVGLLVNFRSPAIKRLRWFLLMSLVLLCVAQALGRTQLAEDSPDINSENLLVLMAPVLLIFGSNLFLALLDQIQFPMRELRVVALALFAVLACLPLLLTLLHRSRPPSTLYDPPSIQKAVSRIKEKELTMSNIPWAMAWYGQRQCVWWTLRCMPNPKAPDARENFLAINDELKPVSLLYLAPEPIQGDSFVQTAVLGEQSWDFLPFFIAMTQRLPPNFPLHYVVPGFFPKQIVLGDWERGPKPAAPAVPAAP